MRRPSFGRLALALLLLLGVVPAVAGYQIMRDWAAVQATLRLAGVAFALSGTTMLISAVWVFSTLGHRPAPLWSGGIASIVFGSVLAAVTLTDVLPCSGPA